MIDLLLALAFWPWALLLAFLIILTTSAWCETTLWALVGLIAFLGASWFAFDAKPFSWLVDNPLMFIFYLFLYCVVGAMWSLFKWRGHMMSAVIQDALKGAKGKYDKEPADQIVDFKVSSYFPKAALPSGNQDRIQSWIALWPLSALLYVFGDLLGELFSKIFELLSGTYHRITDRYIP